MHLRGGSAPAVGPTVKINELRRKLGSVRSRSGLCEATVKPPSFPDSENRILAGRVPALFVWHRTRCFPDSASFNDSNLPNITNVVR